MDYCLKELVRMGKHFKYIVTCIIMQSNGAGIYTATT